MPTTTKKDLIDMVADATGQKRTTVKRTVQSFLDHVIQQLSEGNRIEFRDFGVFEIRDRRPRMAQNPKTLERVPVPGKKIIKFKSGRLMKQAVEEPETGEVPIVHAGTSNNGKFAHGRSSEAAHAAGHDLIASRQTDG